MLNRDVYAVCLWVDGEGGDVSDALEAMYARVGGREVLHCWVGKPSRDGEAVDGVDILARKRSFISKLPAAE